MASIHPEWKKFLNSGLAKPHLEDFMEKVRRAYLEDVIFPEPQHGITGSHLVL